MTDSTCAPRAACSLTRWLALAVVAATVLTLVGDALIVERAAEATNPKFVIRGDSLYYRTMSESGPSAAPMPFRFRVLVPFSESLLPEANLAGFRIITLLSLWAFYFVSLMNCRACGLSPGVSLLGLVGVFVVPLSLYNYHNPYLIDGFSLLVASLMLYAYLTDRFWMFLTVACVGALTRESLVFWTPIWFLERRRVQGVAVVAVCGGILLAVRLLLAETGEGIGDYVSGEAARIDRLGAVFYFAVKIALTWGALWLAMAAGLTMLPVRRQRRELLWPLAIVMAGALAACLIATDTDRLFAALSPVAVVLCASFFAFAVERRARFAVVIMAVGFALSLFFSIPTIATPMGSWVFRTPLLPRLPVVVMAVGALLLVVGERRALVRAVWPARAEA